MLPTSATNPYGEPRITPPGLTSSSRRGRSCAAASPPTSTSFAFHHIKNADLLSSFRAVQLKPTTKQSTPSLQKTRIDWEDERHRGHITQNVLLHSQVKGFAIATPKNKKVTFSYALLSRTTRPRFCHNLPFNPTADRSRVGHPSAADNGKKDLVTAIICRETCWSSSS